MARVTYFCLGWIMVALGIIGAILPVMPTTIFIILAAWCFGKSSPRFEAWLLNHPILGKSLKAWRANGAISRNSKLLACTGMLAGFAMFIAGAHPSFWLAAVVGAGLLACATYVVSRPMPPDA